MDELTQRQLLDRRAADGYRLGIQACISMHSNGSDALDLAEMREGLVVDGSPVDAFADEPNAGDLLEMLEDIERRLGFNLEPEFFSNMVFVAYLGHLPDLRPLSRGLLETYRGRSLYGLYNFFASMRFACDIDCTGVAMRGRLLMGDVDPGTEAGAAILRETTTRILRSAAVDDLTAMENRTHNKSNGPLARNVFKVYLDDHEVQGGLLDRGLKQDAVVVCHALHPVLWEIAAGRRRLDDRIQLLEYRAGAERPTRREEGVDAIVTANLDFLKTWLSTGAWSAGTRYYPFPETLLCAAANLCSSFPDLFAENGIRSLVRDAIVDRRSRASSPNVLALALRAIAADGVELDSTGDLTDLLRQQERDGLMQFAPFYRMPSTQRTVYFGSREQTLSFAIRALSPRSRFPAPVVGRTDEGEATLAKLRFCRVA